LLFYSQIKNGQRLVIQDPEMVDLIFCWRLRQSQYFKPGCHIGQKKAKHDSTKHDARFFEPFLNFHFVRRLSSILAPTVWQARKIN
jgi:hypothetical protein